MLQWTSVCKYLIKILFSIFLDIYTEVGFLDHTVNNVFDFLRNHYTVFNSSCIILYSHQQCTSFPISPHLHQHLLFSFSVFFLINFYFLIFIYLFILAVLGLRFCARAFSSCDKRGPLFITARGPLTIAASLVAEHRLQTRRLSSCGARA